MHEKQVSTKSGSTLNYIKLFLIVVLFCALISLLYKSFLLVKNSSFKYGSFNLMLLDKNAYVVHIENSDKKISILKIDNAGKLLSGKSRLTQSMILGIFLDSSITASK